MGRDEAAIGVRVAGRPAQEILDQPEHDETRQPGAVDGIEDKDPAGAEDAGRFVEDGGEVVDVLERVGRAHGIEARVGKGERLGACADVVGSDDGGGVIASVPPAGTQRALGDVDTNGVGAGGGVRLRHESRAATEVEEAFAADVAECAEKVVEADGVDFV